LGESTSAPAASLATISSTYAATPNTYAGGASYITQSGRSLAITEIDFSVSLQLASG
jgi:hypothetical protein